MPNGLLLNAHIYRQQSTQFWRPGRKLMRFEYSVTEIKLTQRNNRAVRLSFLTGSIMKPVTEGG